MREAASMKRRPEVTNAATHLIPWWVATIVIIGALLTATGGILALVRPEMLLDPGQAMNQAAHVYASYLVSRNLAIAIMLVVMLALKSRQMLASLMLLAALVQGIDGVVDATTGRQALLPIVVLLAVAFLLGSIRLRH